MHISIKPINNENTKRFFKGSVKLISDLLILK